MDDKARPNVDHVLTKWADGTPSLESVRTANIVPRLRANLARVSVPHGGLLASVEYLTD